MRCLGPRQLCGGLTPTQELEGGLPKLGHWPSSSLTREDNLWLTALGSPPS
jgi:hypothetical protein